MSRKIKRITFERLDDGSWEKIVDDPDDSDFEFVTELDMEDGYSEMTKLTERGWKSRALVHFEGFVFERSRKEKAIQTTRDVRLPKEWKNLLKDPIVGMRDLSSRKPGEIVFKKRDDGRWEEIKDDPNDPETPIVRTFKGRDISNKLENRRRQKWKVERVEGGFILTPTRRTAK